MYEDLHTTGQVPAHAVVELEHVLEGGQVELAVVFGELSETDRLVLVHNAADLVDTVLLEGRRVSLELDDLHLLVCRGAHVHRVAVLGAVEPPHESDRLREEGRHLRFADERVRLSLHGLHLLVSLHRCLLGSEVLFSHSR